MGIVLRMIVLVIQLVFLVGGMFSAYSHYAAYGPLWNIPGEVRLEAILPDEAVESLLAPLSQERFFSLMRVIAFLGAFAVSVPLLAIYDVLVKSNKRLDKRLDDLFLAILRKRSREIREMRMDELPPGDSGTGADAAAEHPGTPLHGEGEKA